MLTPKKPLKTILFSLVLLFSTLLSAAQGLVKMKTEASWSQDYQPFRIAGNLYYVGTYELACYLIVTPAGNILINTGLPGSEGMIKAHVEALGFKFNDIKLLLTTHAHFDHVGAIAAIKKMTGAKLIVNEKDAPVLADGGNSDFLAGGKGAMFEPVKADSLLHEHDTIKFGGMQLLALHHPGHTKGACSFLFNVNDGHRVYRVLIANLPSMWEETKLPTMPTYPEVGKDYGYTFGSMKNLKFDIWLASHASQFGLQDKHKPGDPYNPAAFADQKGYDAALNDLYEVYWKRLNDK